MSEDKQMYNAYQRSLMRQLNAMKVAITSKNYAKAERVVDDMIEDTQANLQED